MPVANAGEATNGGGRREGKRVKGGRGETERERESERKEESARGGLDLIDKVDLSA